MSRYDLVRAMTTFRLLTQAHTAKDISGAIHSALATDPSGQDAVAAVSLLREAATWEHYCRVATVCGPLVPGSARYPHREVKRHSSTTRVFHENPVKHLDWTCPSCFERNYEHREKCRNCKEDRPADAQVVPHVATSWFSSEDTSSQSRSLNHVLARATLALKGTGKSQQWQRCITILSRFSTTERLSEVTHEVLCKVAASLSRESLWRKALDLLPLMPRVKPPVVPRGTILDVFLNALAFLHNNEMARADEASEFLRIIRAAHDMGLTDKKYLTASTYRFLMTLATSVLLGQHELLPATVPEEDPLLSLVDRCVRLSPQAKWQAAFEVTAFAAPRIDKIMLRHALDAMKRSHEFSRMWSHAIELYSIYRTRYGVCPDRGSQSAAVKFYSRGNWQLCTKVLLDIDEENIALYALQDAFACLSSRTSWDNVLRAVSGVYQKHNPHDRDMELLFRMASTTWESSGHCQRLLVQFAMRPGAKVTWGDGSITGLLRCLGPSRWREGVLYLQNLPLPDPSVLRVPLVANWLDRAGDRRGLGELLEKIGKEIEVRDLTGFYYLVLQCVRSPLDAKQQLEDAVHDLGVEHAMSLSESVHRK